MPVRDGELTERSLHDALETEVADGGSPNRLAVGSQRLALVANRIIGDRRDITVLAAVLPAVDVDPELEPGQWELREG